MLAISKFEQSYLFTRKDFKSDHVIIIPQTRKEFSLELCAKFGWNWTSGSKEKGFFSSHQCIVTILLLSPLGKGCGASNHSQPSMLVPSFVEIACPVASEEVKNVKSLQRWQCRQMATKRTHFDSAQVSLKIIGLLNHTMDLN